MIDWSKVKDFSIPEGNVVLIQKNGKVVWKKIKLPGEYQKVEYIESTGTQWLDTGLTINTKTDTIELEFENIETTIYKWIYGEHDTNARFGLGSGDGTDKRNVAYGATTYKTKDYQQYNNKHVFVANQDGVFLDDTKIANFSSFSSTSTLYLFNLNISGNGNYIAKARIWKYKHIRNGTTICELIPCYHKLTNEIGFYDCVTNTILENKGTGVFLKGENVYENLLPNEYQLLDYIESNGGPYIDTELKPDDTYGYVVDIEQISSNGEQCPIGCMDAGNRFVGVYFGHRAEGSVASGLSVGFGSYVKQETYSNGFSINQRVISSCNYMNNRKVIFENNVIKDLSDTHVNGTISRNIHLFNRHYSSSAIFKGRMYHASISKGSDIIADFTPCYRKADNKPGMYDVVRNKFYTASGTGEFTYT